MKNSRNKKKWLYPCLKVSFLTTVISLGTGSFLLMMVLIFKENHSLYRAAYPWIILMFFTTVFSGCFFLVSYLNKKNYVEYNLQRKVVIFRKREIPFSDIIDISITESTRTLYHVKPGRPADSQIYRMAKITYRVESGDSQPQHKVEDIVIGKGTMFEDFLSRRIDELVELFSISKTTQVKEVIFLNFE